MKSIHKINTFAVAINLLLFIVPWFGMLAMIMLGVLQLLLAAGINIRYYRHLDRRHKNLLLTYWLFVIVDFAGIAVLLCADSHFVGGIPSIILLSLFPGFIAFYFVYTTYKITRYFNQL